MPTLTSLLAGAKMKGITGTMAPPANARNEPVAAPQGEPSPRGQAEFLAHQRVERDLWVFHELLGHGVGLFLGDALRLVNQRYRAAPRRDISSSWRSSFIWRSNAFAGRA
jgi:hypothetical protein